MNLKESIQQLVADHSPLSKQVTDIKENAWLIEYGFDSVNSLDLVMSIEEKFDIEIPDEDAVSLQTVEDLVDFVEKELT